MIQRNAILDELNALQADQVTRDNPANLTIPGSHGSFHATVVAIEQLAGVFSDISYRMLPGQALTTEQLPAVGKTLSERLQYLMEPLAPVEFDGQAAVLQMRSVPPSQDAPGSHSYFEVLVRPQQIQLRRYSVQAGKARVPAEMHFMREVCARLGSDLALVHQLTMNAAS